MGKKKCPSCAKKVDKKYSYCPFCGESFKIWKDKEDFGMIGREDDEQDNIRENIPMPLGLDRIMNSLMKQLEKQMNGNKNPNGGFRIQVSTGKPKTNKVHPKIRKVPEKPEIFSVDERELERRKSLKKEDAVSRVRRLADKIIYEISTPGVKSKSDVTITRLEKGFEVKAYSKDRCYYKVIPLKIEFLKYSVSNEKVFVEFKG